MRKLLAVAVLTLALAGCHHATVTTGLAPSAQRIHRGFASSWLWGLVPPSAVDARATCPAGVASVETQRSIGNQLAEWLTLGIYSPMSITVVCAAP